MKVYLVKSIKTNFVQVYSSEQYAEAIAIGRNQAHLDKGTDKEYYVEEVLVDDYACIG
jgi:hypothetical protein